MIKVNSLVRFKNPMQDELGAAYRVLEVNGDRLLVEAQVNMTIKPTQIVKTEDMEIIPVFYSE